MSKSKQKRAAEILAELRALAARRATKAAGPPRVLREEEVFRYEVPPRPPGAVSGLRLVVDRTGKLWLCGGAAFSMIDDDDDQGEPN